MLKKLLPPTGVAATFQDDSLSVGEVTLPDARVISLFNWKDDPQTVSVRLPSVCQITDYWSGKSLGEFQGVFTAKDMPPHSAALLIARARK
jgi:alpha-galactosidase